MKKLKSMLAELIREELEKVKEQNYLVSFRIGEDDDDDMEVKATSKEEAIKKAKEKAPRLSRSFSAKLYKN
jgi:DNA primase large subunit